MKEGNEKKLGVLGGMGSKASAYFYNLIVDLTEAQNDQDHVNAVYINCASMPDRTEAILSGEDTLLKKLLIENVNILASLGVSHIAIPCNTSHFFWKEMQESVDIPIINMVQKTLDFIVEKDSGRKKFLKVGLLATDGTVRTGVYEKYLDDSIMEMVYPSSEMQEIVMDVIYKGVKGSQGVTFNELEEVLDELRGRDCDYIILGCTELSVISGRENDSYIVDALEVLAKEAILMSGKKLKENVFSEKKRS